MLTVADWLANDASGLLRFLFSLGLADWGSLIQRERLERRERVARFSKPSEANC